MLPDIFHVETKLSGSLTRKPHRISSAGLIRRLHSLIYNAACSEQRSTPCTCQVLPMDAPNGPSRAFEQGLKCPAPNRVIHHSSSSGPLRRSEEHTSELQSLMRNSYASFCLKKKHYTKMHK